MKLRLFLQLLNPKDLRNALLGFSVTIGGLILALLTLIAHRTGDGKLAGLAAGASLVFVLLIVIFVIPPLAKNASKEASQLNLPFEVTTGGAVFLGLLVIVAFAAWNTGNNFLFLVLSFLISGFVISFFAGYISLKKLEVRMRFPETIFAAEPTPIQVSLNNKKLLFPSISVVAEVRGREKERSLLINELKEIIPERWASRFLKPPIVKHILDYFIYIPRRKMIENRTLHIFDKRGRFLIKDFELSTKFPFGFFRHRRRLSAQEVELIVFPRVENSEIDINDLPLDTGVLLTNKKGAGQDLLTLREYQPTDDFRRINWKATARTQRLTVADFAAEDEKRATIILDTRLLISKEERAKSLRQRINEEQNGAELSEISKRFEDGISKAASLLNMLTEEDSETHLYINKEGRRFGAGKMHLYEDLRRLASAEADFVESYENGDIDSDLAELLNQRENSHIFMILDKEAKLSENAVENVNVIRF